MSDSDCLNLRLKEMKEICMKLLNKTTWEKSIEIAQELFRTLFSHYKCSSESKKFFAGFSKQLTILSVNLIENNQIKTAVKVLKHYEKIIRKFKSIDFTQEKIDLYNHIACAYKGIGNFHTAKKYLLKALHITRGEHTEKANTYLNFCAVLSELEDHKRALQFGLKAAEYALDELSREECTQHRVSLVGAAYYNVGVQYEFRAARALAITWYEKAATFIKNNDSGNAELLQTFENSLNSLKNTVNRQLPRPQSARPLKIWQEKRLVKGFLRGNNSNYSFSQFSEKNRSVRRSRPTSRGKALPRPTQKAGNNSILDILADDHIEEHQRPRRDLRRASEPQKTQIDKSIILSPVSVFSRKTNEAADTSSEFHEEPGRAMNARKTILISTIKETTKESRAILKLQALFRGKRVRELRRLAGNHKKQLVYRTAVIKNADTYIASVYLAHEYTGVIENSQSRMQFPVNSLENIRDALKNLQINKGKKVTFFDEPEELGKNNIKEEKVKMAKNKYKVTYYTNNKFDKLWIEARLRNKDQPHQVTLYNLTVQSKEEVLAFINQRISKQLDVVDSEIIIRLKEDLPLTLLGAFDKTIENTKFEFRLHSRQLFQGISIIISTRIGKKTVERECSTETIVRTLGIRNIEEYLKDPYLIYFNINLEKKKISLNSSESIMLDSFVKAILSNDYTCKVFKYLENTINYYFIECYAKYAPILKPLVCSEDVLIGLTQGNEADFHIISHILTEIGGDLVLDPSLLIEPEPTVTPIIQFQGLQDTETDQISLYEKAGEDSRKLITRDIKEIENIYYRIDLFQRCDDMLLEVYDPDENLILSHNLENNENHRKIFDRVVSCNDKIIFHIQKNGESIFDKDTITFQKHINEEPYTIEVVKTADSIAVKISPDMGGNPVVSRVPIQEFITKIGSFSLKNLKKCLKVKEDQIILESSPKRATIFRCVVTRAEVKYHAKVSIYTHTLTSPLKTDILSIKIRNSRQSSHKFNQKIKITLQEACSHTGFSAEELVPLSHYLLNNTLIIQGNSLSFPSALSKAQAVLRGFLTRVHFTPKLAGKYYMTITN